MQVKKKLRYKISLLFILAFVCMACTSVVTFLGERGSTKYFSNKDGNTEQIAADSNSNIDFGKEGISQNSNCGGLCPKQIAAEPVPKVLGQQTTSSQAQQAQQSTQTQITNPVNNVSATTTPAEDPNLLKCRNLCSENLSCKDAFNQLKQLRTTCIKYKDDLLSNPSCISKLKVCGGEFLLNL